MVLMIYLERWNDILIPVIRLQLRLGTQEIRDLESQLRACYVGKGVHSQMKEKQLQQIREEVMDLNE